MASGRKTGSARPPISANKTTARYITASVPNAIVAGWCAEASSDTLAGQTSLGQPFRFGQQLHFQRAQSGAAVVSASSNLAYLDPSLLWMPNLAQHLGWVSATAPVKAPIVKASVVNHTLSLDQAQNTPPPAAVTISSVQASTTAGLLHTQVTGVATRELGAQPHATSYTVFERLDPAAARRRLAAAASSGQDGRLSGGGPPGESGVGALQRAVQAWAEEEQCGVTSGPGPAPSITSRGAALSSGPAFTMGCRTKAVVPGLSLVAPDTALVPGPGAYNTAAAAGRAGPAFSLAGRAKPAAQEVLPGPGQYDGTVSSLGSGPAFSLGAKAKDKVEELPGPGDYDLARSIATGPAATIAGRPKPLVPEALPGPADYQQLHKPGKGAPAFTISARTERPANLDVPAPGEYDVPPAWTTGPAVSMAARPANKVLRDIGPGPGEYNPPRSCGMALDGPAFSLATRPVVKPLPDSPGPGEYHNSPEKATGPAYTMVPRPLTMFATVAANAALLPGPGQYDMLAAPRPGSPSAPAYTMQGRTHAPEAAQVPGPGQYDVPGDPQGSGPAFTMASKAPDVAAPSSPGPAAYTVEDSVLRPAAPAFTMGVRRAERAASEDGPAPGDYEVDRDAWRQGPAFSMPAASSAPLAPAPDSPGPGEYTLPSAPGRGPAFSIPATGRPSGPTAQDSPGPADYHMDSPGGGGGPAFTMGTKPLETAAREEVPGPGQYHHAAPQAGPAFTFPAAKEHEPKSDLTNVGPGAYDPLDPSLPSAPAFSMRARPADGRADQDVPGPGAYAEVASPRGPSYTIAPRPASPGAQDGLPGADSPGPSAYALPSLPSGPAFTLAARPPPTKAVEQAPGPADYLCPSPTPGPAFSLGARPAEGLTPPSPGPGDYQHAHAASGPAYTIAARHGECQVVGQAAMPSTDSPGPGAYGSPGQGLVGAGGPAFTFRERTRGSAWAQGPQPGPGPGEYADPPSPSGPAYSLGARTALALKGAGADAPGPGEYDAPAAIGAGGPAFSLGAKLPPPKSTADSSPAPGDYGVPETAGPLGPAFTLGAKRSEPDPRLTLPNPGPGEHQRLYPAPSGPAFSLGARLRELLGKKKGRQAAAGPDPGQYHQDPGTAGPAFTFAARVGGSGGTAGGASTLGPTDTSPWPAPPSGPAWTLAPKLVDAVPAMQPGPGQYTVPGTAAVGILPFGGAAAASSGPRKHVSFSGGTHFRDSTEQRSTLQGQQQRPPLHAERRATSASRARPQRDAARGVGVPASQPLSRQAPSSASASLLARYASQPAGSSFVYVPPPPPQPTRVEQSSAAAATLARRSRSAGRAVAPRAAAASAAQQPELIERLQSETATQRARDGAAGNVQAASGAGAVQSVQLPSASQVDFAFPTLLPGNTAPTAKFSFAQAASRGGSAPDVARQRMAALATPSSKHK